MDPFDRLLGDIINQDLDCPAHGDEDLMIKLVDNEKKIQVTCMVCVNAITGTMSNPKYFSSAMQDFRDLTIGLTSKYLSPSYTIGDMTIEEWRKRHSTHTKGATVHKHFGGLALREFQKKEYELICHGFTRGTEKEYKHLNVPVYLTNVVIRYYAILYNSDAFMAWKSELPFGEHW